MKQKLIRVCTHDISLDGLLKGQLHFLSSYFEVVGVAADTGDLQRVAEREGIRVVNIPMHREIALGADLKSLWMLYRLFRKERPTLVHANTPKGSLLAMWAAKLANVPIRIYTVTGLRYQGTMGKFRTLLQTMERLTCRAATHVIPEGEGVRRALMHDHITNKPLEVVHNGNINGVDTTYFDPANTQPGRAAMRQQLRLRPEDFVFVFIGRIVADKGMNELATAMRRLGDCCKLILVGNMENHLDPLAPGNEDFFRHSPSVRYVGVQNDVRPYLLAADALVFPSYREGFPNVVLEAGAMGLPAIVTDINGCNEIVLPPKNGMIIPPRDVQALINAMRTFLAKRTAVAQMRGVARDMVVQRYARSDVWQALLERYKRILSEMQM